jgi:acyl carrier protein
LSAAITLDWITLAAKQTRLTGRSSCRTASFLQAYDIFTTRPTFEFLMSSPSEQDLRSTVNEFLQEQFDIPASKLADDPAMRELDIDSIMMMHILLDLEDKVHVKIEDFTMPANPRISDIVAMIQRNLTAANGTQHG